MKAVICTKYGSPEVLQINDLPKPKSGKNEILVKILATAVNSGDVRTRSLDAQGILRFFMRIVLGWSKPRKPVLGTVYSGIVENVGSNVFEFKTGDKVFGMTGFNFGTYAEYIAVSENSHILPMPYNASFEEAASIIFGGQTAQYYLDKARISKKIKSKILILGATGSVGASAIQFAKQYGGQVTAVCSSQGYSLIKQLGVERVIQYDKESLATHTEKYDVIFDAVGKYNKKNFKHLLNKNGRFLSVSIGYAAEKLHQLQKLKELFENGQLQAVIDKTFCLDNIKEAHKYVDTGRKKGNVVIKVNH